MNKYIPLHKFIFYHLHLQTAFYLVPSIFSLIFAQFRCKASLPNFCYFADVRNFELSTHFLFKITKMKVELFLSLSPHSITFASWKCPLLFFLLAHQCFILSSNCYHRSHGSLSCFLERVFTCSLRRPKSTRSQL